MKLGANDYLIKRLDVVQVRELVRRALKSRRMTDVPVTLPDAEPARADCELLVGHSLEMLAGLQDDRPRCGAGRAGAHLRRERHGHGIRRSTARC